MKNKTALIIGMALSLAMVFFAVGCGSGDSDETEQMSRATDQTQKENAAGSGAPQLSIEVIFNGNMGSGWSEEFEKGVQTTLDQLGNGSRMTTAGITDTVSASELIEQGLTEHYDGIILAAEADRENAGDAIDRAAQEGVPVLNLLDNADDGYGVAVPDDMGSAMAEALISRIALYKGAEAWGDPEDFSKRLDRAVQGNWRTFSSAGNQKLFVNPYVMEFSPNSEGLYEMNRVSLIKDVKDTPDGKGYNYVLNTGNNYYLYPENPDTLECHWEPDGYSGSDSLNKESDDTGDSTIENSVFVLDMNTYSDSEEYFQGTVTTFDGYGAMGPEPEECVALNLASPVRVYLSDGRDVLLNVIQLNPADTSLSDDLNKGTVIKVTGKLFEAETDHHFTPVIMNVSGVE